MNVYMNGFNPIGAANTLLFWGVVMGVQIVNPGLAVWKDDVDFYDNLLAVVMTNIFVITTCMAVLPH